MFALTLGVARGGGKDFLRFTHTQAFVRGAIADETDQ